MLALITMLMGTFAALPQTNLKRMLAYSSVVHMGYLLIAVLVGGPDGGQALLFYLVVYGIATFGAFGVVTSFASAQDELQDYDDLQGLGYQYPKRSIVLATLLLSLAGIPPLAGFLPSSVCFRVLCAMIMPGWRLSVFCLAGVCLLLFAADNCAVYARE